MSDVKGVFLMRKIISTVAALSLTIMLTACQSGNNPSGKIGSELGLDLSDSTVISKVEDHGFFGDGTTYDVLTFEDDSVLQQIQNDSDWKPLPMDETTTALVYGLEDDFYQKGPYLNDNNGNPLFPEVENGYYLLIDRQNDAQDILDRHSFNFTVAVFDSDENTLHYGKLDT